MHLVQTGRLDLDADVNSYLKTWKLPENEFTAQKKATLRGLLSHTAGVTVHGFGGYASGAEVPSLVQVLNGEKPANSPAIRVDTVPGTKWRYSGGGYVITQQLLQDMSGQAFPAFMHDTLFEPLGMRHSTFEQPLPSGKQADVATPYDRNGVAVAGGAHTYPEMAPAGLWTTPSDLARYAIGVQQALAGATSRVLSKATATEMLKDVGLGHQGLGPALGGKPDHPWFAHNGVDEGFVANFIAYDHGDGAFIMTNAMNGGRLSDEILRTIALEYHWPDYAPPQKEVAKVPPQLLDAYAGDYRQGRFTVLSLSRDNGHLIAKQDAQDLGPLYPASDRDWFFTASPVRLTFQAGADGRASAFVRHADGLDISVPRMDDGGAKKIADELAAKIKNQTQDPDTEAAVRRSLAEWRAGAPDYDRLSPGLARVIRQEIGDLQTMVKDFGAIRTISFKGVAPSGADIYDVTFDSHTMQWQIIVGPDGKSEFITFNTGA